MKFFSTTLLLCVFMSSIFSISNAQSKTEAIGTKKPKLVLVLVYDQFRADMLTRYQNQFQKKGFRYLLDHGAYYPYAEYEVLQNITCSGHAMILSGSYPYNNGIPMNDWVNPENGKNIYCIEDAEFGSSPRKLHATTVGDELKMAFPKSTVVGLALKDRSAIMLGGHAANLALWLNTEKMEWETSGYYKNSGNLDWLKQSNKKTSQLLGSEVAWNPSFGKAKFQYKYKANTNNALGTPFGTELTNKMATESFKNMKLGQSGQTDLLAISFSSHDLNGHAFGPNSPENEEMTLSEDYYLSELFKTIDQSVGLKNTWIVLTADHGVAPTVNFALANGLDAGTIDSQKMIAAMTESLDQKYGSPNGKKWFAGTSTLQYYFTREVLEQYKSKIGEVESIAKNILLKQAGVAYVLAKTEFQSGHHLPEMHGRQSMKSYYPGVSGDLMIIPKPNWFLKGTSPGMHMTGYSYDRTVPLILSGSAFKKGIYGQTAHVVDLAPTLTFLLGTIPPSLSEGRVLSEAIQR